MTGFWSILLPMKRKNLLDTVSFLYVHEIVFPSFNPLLFRRVVVVLVEDLSGHSHAVSSHLARLACVQTSTLGICWQYYEVGPHSSISRSIGKLHSVVANTDNHIDIILESEKLHYPNSDDMNFLNIDNKSLHETGPTALRFLLWFHPEMAKF